MEKINKSISPKMLGNSDFKKDYHIEYAYCGGAMAGGISSVEMVKELGKNGFIGSFGSGGCSIDVIEHAIDELSKALPQGQFMINMLSSRDANAQMKLAKLLVEKDVKAVEASAYIEITKPLVYYKLKGAKILEDGKVYVPHKIMAKLSREEVLSRFMEPISKKIVDELLQEGLINDEEAKVAEYIPTADDITVEADSGGHTDGRPLISMLPAMIALRNRLQEKYKYKKIVRVGAGGGIGTGLSALGAFTMGADYVVVGSVHQSCIEAGTSDYVKSLLVDIKMSEVTMAPCADMFETGAKVQVIKKATMYSGNAQKLYDYYCKYPSIEAIPSEELAKIEKRIFRKSIDQIWMDTKNYFEKVNPKMIDNIENKPKQKMALIFRWYLGKSSNWAITGDTDHRTDMQIWCGQALGAFNLWVRGTELEKKENRKVVDVAHKIMDEAAKKFSELQVI